MSKNEPEQFVSTGNGAIGSLSILKTMQDTKHSIPWLLGLVLFMYVIIRAYTVPITYDEAWTLRDYVPLDFADILRFSPTDANNHILCTLLIKAMFEFLPDSSFVARIPAILGSLLFILFSIRLALRLLPQPYQHWLLLPLLLNPFVIDFFSLARGYGLALGFQMAAIFFFVDFAEHRNKVSSVVLSLTLAGLAAYSNLSFLAFGLVLFGSLQLMALEGAGNFKGWWLASWGQLLVVLAVFLAIYEPIRKLRKSDSLYYGGTEGLLKDTFSTLIEYSAYRTISEEVAFLLAVAFIGMLGIGFLLFIRNRITHKKLFSLNLVYSAFLLLGGLMLFHELNYRILGVVYPIDRVALPYVPVIAFVCTLFMAKFSVVLPMISRMTVYALAILSVINFSAAFNTHKTILWEFDAHSLEALRYLEQLNAHEEQNVLCSAWPFQSTMKHHLAKNSFQKAAYIFPIDQSSLQQCAYYLYYSRSMIRVGYDAEGNSILDMEKDTLLAYPKDGVWLFKLRHPSSG